MDVNRDNADSISINTNALENDLIKERNAELRELFSLKDKLIYLHTSLLFFRNEESVIGSTCYDTWKALVLVIGGIEEGWKELGQFLGIQREYFNYILQNNNLPVDAVLQVFAQDDTATLDKVYNFFIITKRFDILKCLQEPLTKLAQCFIKSQSDSGYQSDSNNGLINKNKKTRNINKYLEWIPNLPAILLKTTYEKPIQPPHLPWLLQPIKQQERNDNRILFLTFTDDGIDTVFNIRNCVQQWTEVSGVTIITLSDNKEEVCMQPEQFITNYFEKANLIVPILTPGYLDEISNQNGASLNAGMTLDSQYVKFIFSKMWFSYMGSNCYNLKIRSVLSKSSDFQLLRQSISKYPIFSPWTHESKFNEYFKAFLHLESRS